MFDYYHVGILNIIEYWSCRKWKSHHHHELLDLSASSQGKITAMGPFDLKTCMLFFICGGFHRTGAMYGKVPPNHTILTGFSYKASIFGIPYLWKSPGVPYCCGLNLAFLSLNLDPRLEHVHILSDHAFMVV